MNSHQSAVGSLSDMNSRQSAVGRGESVGSQQSEGRLETADGGLQTA
jgi:hypothetical protein